MVKNYNVFKYIPIIMGLLLGACVIIIIRRLMN